MDFKNKYKYIKYKYKSNKEIRLIKRPLESRRNLFILVLQILHWQISLMF